MKLQRKFLLFPAMLAIVFAACTQDPLLYYIHLEYPPINPTVNGAPSQIVEDSSSQKLYVSNRTVWECDISSVDNTWKPNWTRMSSQPPETVKTLAVAGSTLYALGWNGTVYENTGGTWAPVSGTPPSGLQRMYGANDGSLFLGSGDEIFYYNGSTFSSLGTGTGILTGAVHAGSTYYLGTKKMGLVTTTTLSPPLTHEANVTSPIVGLISLNSGAQVVAVGENRVIYYGTTGSFSSLSPAGVEFSGGLALWKQGSDRILLLGLKDGSGTFSYGYRELDLNPSGEVDPSSGLYAPGSTDGGRTTTINPNSSHTAAIGNHPVNALYVVINSNADISTNTDPSDPIWATMPSGPRPVIFASTQQNGLWSYRYRNNGGAQWNGEDGGN